MLRIFYLFLVVFFPRLSHGLLVLPPIPTKSKLFLGLGIPLNLEDEAVSYAWTLKAQYYFPKSSVDPFKYLYFPRVRRDVNGNVLKNVSTLNSLPRYKESFFSNASMRRKREIMIDKNTGQKYEKYDAEVEEIGNEMLHDDSAVFDDQIDTRGMIPTEHEYYAKEEELMDTSGTRWLLYDGFGKMLTIKGIEGRYCVLRSICEAAETNFGYHNGLFGQLFHLFFTPSSTNDPIVNKDHYDYVKAELLGKAGEPCDKIFYQCKRSILDIFTKIYDLNDF